MNSMTILLILDLLDSVPPKLMRGKFSLSARNWLHMVFLRYADAKRRQRLLAIGKKVGIDFGKSG